RRQWALASSRASSPRRRALFRHDQRVLGELREHALRHAEEQKVGIGRNPRGDRDRLIGCVVEREHDLEIIAASPEPWGNLIYKAGRRLSVDFDTDFALLADIGLGAGKPRPGE